MPSASLVCRNSYTLIENCASGAINNLITLVKGTTVHQDRTIYSRTPFISEPVPCHLGTHAPISGPVLVCQDRSRKSWNWALIWKDPWVTRTESSKAKDIHSEQELQAVIQEPEIERPKQVGAVFRMMNNIDNISCGYPSMQHCVGLAGINQQVRNSPHITLLFAFI